jgi:RNA polymerase sigma-70 factor (ECF subfamily)
MIASVVRFESRITFEGTADQVLQIAIGLVRVPDNYRETNPLTYDPDRVKFSTLLDGPFYPFENNKAIFNLLTPQSLPVAETPVSLLERLRAHPDQISWGRFVDLYNPLIRGWVVRHGLQPTDIDDVTQEVFAAIVRELPEFHHDFRRGAFRRWLRTVVVNRLRNFWRARDRAAQQAAEPALALLEDPASGLSRIWDEEHDKHVARRLLVLIEPEFEPVTWQAFRLLVMDGLETQEVAARLGITPNAVRIAKSRVLGRFRREAEGLID